MRGRLLVVYTGTGTGTGRRMLHVYPPLFINPTHHTTLFEEYFFATLFRSEK